MTAKLRTFCWFFTVVAALILAGQVFAEGQTTEDETITTQDIADEQELDIFDLSIEELMEIEISSTASLTGAKPRLVPATVTTITEQMIRSSGARSLYELMDIYVPNFQWIFHTAEVRHMGLRGILSNLDDKYLLLVNGRVMNEKTDMGAWTERDLPMLTDIHHIDVVRGPGSALYGPGALAMVINIVTHNADTFQGFETTFRVGSIEEFYSGEFRYGKKFDDDSGLFLYAGSTLYPGATLDHSPYYLGRSDEIEGKWYYASDAITKALHGYNQSFQDKPKWKVFGQYTKGGLDIWARFTQGGEYEDHLTRWAISGRERWYDEGAYYQQLTGYISYDHEINPELSIKSVFSVDTTQVQSEDWAFRLRSFRENEYYARIVANWKPHEQHSFAVGGEWSHEQFGRKHTSYDDKAVMFIMTGWFSIATFEDSTDMPKWSTDLLSGFGEYQWNINDQWTTFLGARVDDHPYADPMFSPRGAVIYTPTDEDTVKFMISRSVRTDSAVQMKQAIMNDPDNKTEVEVLKATELRYERQHTENLWLAGGAFYHWNDAIGWGSSRLIGAIQSYGLEAEASYRKGKTRIDLSHSFTKMCDFEFADGVTSAELSAAPMGYGNDFANWSNHLTKLVVHRDLEERWKLDGSAYVYWGYPGGQDYAEHQYNFIPALYKWGYTRSFRPSVFFNLGLEHKIKENQTLRIDGYNLLGFIHGDFNKRRIGFNTWVPAQFRCAPPSIGVSLMCKY